MYKKIITALEKLSQLLLWKPIVHPETVPQVMCLEVNIEAQKEVERMIKTTGVSGPVEIIRRSLAIYGVLLDQAADKGTIILKDSDGTIHEFDPVSFTSKKMNS